MEIRSVYTLRGPNIWSRNPVLEAWVDLGALKDSASDEMSGFNDRLMAWLPTMIEHRCSIGERGGFFERLRRGTYLAHILEHVTLELQSLAGTEVGFGRARETSEEGVYKVAVRYENESLGRACLEKAKELCLAAVYDRPFDVAVEVGRLRALADRVCLGPSTKAIVEAARQRGIPARRLNDGSLVQLGQGVKQRRIWTAETDRTSAIAESIAQDKELTKSLLRAAGVPVPHGRIVESRDDAWEASQEIGSAVVVKPRDANHARGVFLELTERDRIEAAYDKALLEGSGVMVERYVPGVEHRLLVVGRRMIAAVAGDQVWVTGDGTTTIRQLVDEQVNSDPRRGEDETCPLSLVEFDAVVVSELERQGYSPQSVPPAGVRVLIARSDNLSVDVTDLVHPTVAEHVVMAADIVGLDVAGLDVVACDISRPLEEQGGAIVEVNAGPGLLMHLKPAVGQPRPVGEAIVATLFPEHENGRIPLVAVTGTNGKSIVTTMLAAILRECGRTVGMASSDGINVNGRWIERGDCAGPRSAQSVLLNPYVDSAVFEVGRGGILREGLGFDKCDVAVVTNIGSGDHLGQWSLETPEDLFKVKRTPVDVVLPTGAAVLNAADPLVAEMAPLSAGEVIFFAVDADLSIVRQHRAEGKRAVVVRDGRVVLANGSEESVLIELSRVPVTRGGRVPFQTENVLAAAAAAWALGISAEAIAGALAGMAADHTLLPGRLNVYDSPRGTVIVDFCRNLSALSAVVEAIGSFTADRLTAVYSSPADRRDCDILAQAERLGRHFDRVCLYPPGGNPERAAAVVDLFRRGLVASPLASEILEFDNQTDAVSHVLSTQTGRELALIQISEWEPVFQQIQEEWLGKGDGLCIRISPIAMNVPTR